MRQFALLAAEESLDLAAVDELAALVRSVDENLGPKEVAARLGISVSSLSHALANRDYRRVPAEWLPALVRMDPERRIARWFAALGGFDVTEVDRRTDAEKLAAAVDALEAFGDAGLAALRKAKLK
jgi:hypothetical protein